MDRADHGDGSRSTSISQAAAGVKDKRAAPGHTDVNAAMEIARNVFAPTGVWVSTGDVRAIWPAWLLLFVSRAADDLTEPTMILFARFAYFTLVRDAAFVGMAAALLMMAFSYSLPIAFDVGATIILAFALGLLLRACFLTDQRFVRSEAWTALQEDERPVGEEGMHWARVELEKMMLRFAKTAAGIAGLLYCSALVSSIS